MRTHRFVVPALVLLALALLLPAPARGQLRIIPQVGLYTPLSDLPSAGDAVEIGERESSFAYGAALEFGDREGTAFRITALRGTDSEVPVVDLGCTECARSSVTSLTGAVVFRPFSLVVLRPYLLAGAGIRRIEFEREDLDEEGFDALFSDENDFAGHLGLGAEIGLPFLDLEVGLSDVISPLENPDGESELQHDFFLMLGLTIG